MLLRRISNARHNTPGKPASVTPILAGARISTVVIGAIFPRSVIATASAATCLPSSHPHSVLSLRHESRKGGGRGRWGRKLPHRRNQEPLFQGPHTDRCAVYKQMSAISARGASLLNALIFTMRKKLPIGPGAWTKKKKK